MKLNGRRILDPNVPERRGERGRVLPVVRSKVGTEYEEHDDHQRKELEPGEGRGERHVEKRVPTGQDGKGQDRRGSTGSTVRLWLWWRWR